MPPARLVDRRPEVPTDRLVAGLVPPPRFDGVRFATYRPAHPSQASALAALEEWVSGLSGKRPGGLASVLRRRRPTAGPTGIYLDGGYGVGKTHLLASAWHAAPAPRAYATFAELTDLVGALGFAGAVAALSGHRLLCIDEFELDDVGSTVLVSTLLQRLVDAGVAVAATSNTLPSDLGQGRFNADDFLREIQALAGHFRALRVEGEDYRHRGLPAAPAPLSDAELSARAQGSPGAVTLDDFGAVVTHLGSLHPVRYGALVEGLHLVCLRGVTPVGDQADALRVVVLADRLYDRDVAVAVSGTPLDRLFPDELMAGGYRKKYQRAVSRLVALSRG